ncbi:MAG TPA: tetratricopeptide repeat protein [Terriglobales bacterium]|nr:tetratricopeptide repeat protein [Terriglobales bacterium]
MTKLGLRFVVLVLTAAVWVPTPLLGRDLKITLPKHSRLTPVQKLNREGVKQIEKRHIEKAKKLFYQAYLLDPNDPFTLNNLGYTSELEGDADRALRYYELSAKNASDATIDVASRPDLRGKPLQDAFTNLNSAELKANKANVEAISLVGKGRIAEAEDALRRALAGAPHNPFTLNNMGYVMEAEGDLQSALKYYSAAASLHSTEVILVAPNEKWRGKPISEIAAQNAKLVSETIARGEDLQARVARLNLRGVAALNHNDPNAARQFFQEAYKLDPNNAFSLNNMGYVAEMNGDRETAETYYADARAAADRNFVVTYASRREAEGKPVGSVAQQNENDTESAIEALQQARRREGEPMPQLKRRDNTVVPEPELNKPAPPLNGVTPPPLPPPEVPDRVQQPQSQGPPRSGMISNPQATPAPNTPPQVTAPPQSQGDILQPLPESQQPQPVQTQPNSANPPRR